MGFSKPLMDSSLSPFYTQRGVKVERQLFLFTQFKHFSSCLDSSGSSFHIQLAWFMLEGLEKAAALEKKSHWLSRQIILIQLCGTIFPIIHCPSHVWRAPGRKRLRCMVNKAGSCMFMKVMLQVWWLKILHRVKLVGAYLEKVCHLRVSRWIMQRAALYLSVVVVVVVFFFCETELPPRQRFSVLAAFRCMVFNSQNPPAFLWYRCWEGGEKKRSSWTCLTLKPWLALKPVPDLVSRRTFFLLKLLNSPFS